MATAGLLVTLVTYLVCVSTVLSLTFVGEVEQMALHPTIDLSISNESLSQIENLSEIEYITTAGQWNTEIGKGIYSVLNYTPKLFLPKRAENTIIFPQLETSAEGVYHVEYQFYNSNHNEFSVFIVHRSFLSDIYVIVDEDGFNLKGGTFMKKSFHESNVLDSDYINITTEYDVETGSVKFWYEDELIFDDLIILFAPYLMPITHYFCGVTTWGSDFEILAINGLIIYSDENLENNFSMTSFIRMILLLFFWTLPDSILPLQFNLVFIKIPLIGLSFIVIQTLRGTG